MKSIKIENFRCFERLEIEFKDRINLLIGDNAAGKTSLLKACKYALSAWFSGFSDENTRWQTFKECDFRNVEFQGFKAPEERIRIYFDLSDDTSDLGYVTSGGLFNRIPKEQYIGRNSKKNSRFLQSGVAELRKFGEFVKSHYITITDKSVKQHMALPLLVSFSTEDIHAKRKIRENSYMNYTQKASFGYYECLNANGLYKYWRKRLLTLYEAYEDSREVQVVCDAVVKALGPEGCNIIKRVQVRPMKKDVYYELVDGRKVASAQLSDGYRRLVNIVTDIAFRCYLLNGAMTNFDPIKDTHGVVLIDEIDMHLHPTLQANVAKALSDTFEGLQFIITSHAPMVMSSVKTDDKNVVYKLDYKQEEGYVYKTLHTYGQDMTSIMRRYLDLTPRVSEVQERIDKMNEHIDAGNTVEARKLLEELQREFTDTMPELVRAESNLRFLDE